MEKEEQAYTTYLLRLWPRKSGEKWVWLASLEYPYTGERLGFTSLQEMFRYLEEEICRRPAGGYQSDDQESASLRRDRLRKDE